MNIFSDLLTQFYRNTTVFAQRQTVVFFLTVFIALVMAALCWWACSRWTRLFNLRYRITLTHHLLCGVAALLTFIFVILFAGMTYMQEVAELRVMEWQQQLIGNEAWGNRTLASEYNAVKALNIEDFKYYSSATVGVPVTKTESRQVAAKIIADEAAKDFSDSHPFLSRIIHASTDIPADIVAKDIDDFFKTNQHSYPNSKGIDLAARQIKEDLDVQTPRVVTVSRLLFGILFLLVQFIPFGLIGFAAHKDLKIST